MQSLTFRINPWLAFAGVVCSVASTGVNAGSLHVTVADALSNQAYDLSFAPPSTTALGITPLPASPTASVRSIVYVPNEQTAKADLIAADNRHSLIVRYAGAAGPALTVWSGTGAGPSTPVGLSVDSFGNLFVGRGDVGSPELWVLKRDPALPAGAGFLAPVPVDKTGFGKSNQTRILDALVVQAPTPGGVGAGDLLVLLNDGRVLRYSVASLKSFLAGGGLTDPHEGAQPKTLIPAGTFPPGHASTSIAVWPTDGSLLISTVGGEVLRYTLTPTGSTRINSFATGFASTPTGVGSMLGQIRTFVSSTGPYAVLDIPSRSQILEFSDLPGGCPSLGVLCNPPQATITTVSTPVGLSVTDASTSNGECDTTLNPNGCALLSGSVKVRVSSATDNGSVIAVSCTVDDPRFTNLGNCNSNPLKASDVCPGYPDTYVPTYLCGASGASGHAMTFLKFEEASGFATAPSDLLVNIELTAEALLGGAAPLCPQLASGWAPLAAEGVIPEGNFMMEPTAYCGSTRQLVPGHSLMLVGAQINPGTDLVALANLKFDALSSQNPPIGTIQAATNMNGTAQAALASCVDHGKTLLNASSLTPAHRYACAAHQSFLCDQTVVSGQFVQNPNQLSALSAIKGRLENLIMHIDNRIISPGSTPPWPQVDPMPEDSTTVANCDITAPSVPTGLTATYVGTNNKTVNLTWTASTDSGQTVATVPGPYAAGVAGYHVYLNGIEQPGSPTSSTALQITPKPSSKTNRVTITAFDNATPAPNVSAPAALVLN